MKIEQETKSMAHPSSAELPIQYADFGHWQRQWLQGEVLEAQLAYWKQQLDGIPPLLELPTDYPRPPVQTYRGVRQSLVLSKTLTEALNKLSQQEGVTLFMTLLAAFKTLLYRYTRQEDILVGTPIANHNWAECEGLIDFFVNTLVLRTDISGNPSFRELLERVRRVALGAYDHQDLPFEKLVEELQSEQDLSRSPLFQVMFSLQNAPKQALESPCLTLSPLEVDSGTAKFDLTLEVQETSEGLRGWFKYNKELFKADTIARMAGHFQTLLEGVVANPEQCISDLLLLTAAERHQLLIEWNNTQADYSKDVCIHQLFEAQVERTSDAVAVVFEDKQLTYRELNVRANQLAHHLQHLGVGSEVLVGICVERSLEMLIGILGILKAGGAYLPLDPAYPQERLAFMLEDAEVPVLLTTERLLETLPSHSAKVVCLDTDEKAIAQQSKENPLSGATANNLAYVIYTSGSTGKPKGVLVSHANVVRLFETTQSWYHFNKQDVWTLFHSYAFDFSVWEIWGALLYGGRLVVVPYLSSRSPEVFYDLLCKERVTVLNQTPSAFRQLMRAEESLGTTKDLSLRLVIFGGEALELQSLKPWFERHGDKFPQLVNMYGITETTVHVTYRPLKMADLSGTGSVIGKPIPDLQVYVLDQHRQPVPIGVPGEMYIGGAGLARGYLNRPYLDAERFILNPFSNKPDARLYKSGDLARYLPNGDIEYLGRIDHQVKIRGFRIELGEISAVLGQHPAVREAVVLVREDVPGDKRLVAYVIPYPKQAPKLSELRHCLKEKLPDYMVPSAFVLLDALPLTLNGKVDRRALPAPNQVRQPEETFVAPRDELEFQLSKIWGKVLGIEPIGVRDNFFDLGGSSLNAVCLFEQIEKTFGKNFPLSILFHAPTVEQLASILRQKESSAPCSSLVAIQPGGSKLPFFCIHEVNGQVLFYRDLARHLAPDQPFYCLQPQGLDGKQALLTRIEDMAAHYIKEIRTLQPEGPYFLGGFSLGGEVAFEMAQQLHAQGQKVALLALFDNRRSGYPKVLPFHHRVFLHLNNFLRLQPKEKLAYVLKKVKNRIRIAYEFFLGIKCPLPQDLQLLPIVENHILALKNYVPQVYPGRVTLFRVKEEEFVEFYDCDPQWGWGGLAAGGLELHRVPGNHVSMIKEPHVQVLAEKLRACLDQAQADI